MFVHSVFIESNTYNFNQSGGVDIEMVAREHQNAIISEQIDSHRGLERKQALRIVNAVGFSPAVHNTVRIWLPNTITHKTRDRVKDMRATKN